ncbi:hypothetical protein E1B03_19085 [Citrobacter arsenatis]|uniref:Uncharacterized protein n=1 Tax=Citrobacter arsenatis TaxID=2546350 RepID=A0A4P6WLU3_9ENTR|nr:hypothetical protein E1B03_19085 [Citrobacter arsenatis]
MKLRLSVSRSNSCVGRIKRLRRHPAIRQYLAGWRYAYPAYNELRNVGRIRRMRRHPALNL